MPQGYLFVALVLADGVGQQRDDTKTEAQLDLLRAKDEIGEHRKVV